MEFSDFLEVFMLHGLAGCYSLVLVILQHLVQQADPLFGDEMLVAFIDKLRPAFLRSPIL